MPTEAQDHDHPANERRAGSASSVSVDQYLARIGIERWLPPTPQNLAHLQLAHQLRVPFENLSIGWGEHIELDETRLLDKIVTRRRGGFCYELNGAFAWLLRSLGFHVDGVEAGVWNSEHADFGPPFDHMALLVEARDAATTTFLVDVGFGRAPRRPLRVPQDHTAGPHGEFRLHMHSGEGLLERVAENGQWQPSYRFSTTPRSLADYAAMCSYHQTSPESIFTQRQVCTRATPTGRVSLTPQELVVTESGQRTVTQVDDTNTYRRLLVEHFGIWYPV